jgi:hypothetical protein
MKKYISLNNAKQKVCNYAFPTTIQQFHLQSPVGEKRAYCSKESAYT